MEPRPTARAPRPAWQRPALRCLTGAGASATGPFVARNEGYFTSDGIRYDVRPYDS